MNAATGTEAVLLQQGGLGGAYQSIATAALVSTALNSSSLGVGNPVPTNAVAGNILTDALSLPNDASILWNAYAGQGFVSNYWQSGLAASTGFNNVSGWDWQIAPVGAPNTPIANWSQLMTLSVAGALALPSGTLTVARDPAAASEVATMRYVGNNTVASFNGRNGAVTLNSNDIYSALGLCSPIATEDWVTQQITASLQSLLMTCPFVNRWNGRSGSVYLMLSDISCVFFQPGQQPITPTPPLTSNDYSIANTAWVVEYLTNELAGGGTNFATQAWVLANTVNSFNGRMGPVTLTLADVTNVGGAPLASPNFSGYPTAPTQVLGTANATLATTSFVQMAITESTAGVSSFNTRTGAVTLTNADITGAGGLANPGATLTGNPTAPTQAPGTTTPTIANCEFVMTAIGNAVTSFNTRTGAVTLLLSDVTSVGGAPLASPTFTGVPAAPTANAGTNTTQLATTAFVMAAVASEGGVTSFNGRTGAVELEANDVSAVGGLINPSPQLTGVPIAPTATAGTNTNQIATTAFVITTIGSSAVSSFNTRTGAVTLSAADITGAGGALLASPTFTGTPQAPTAAAGTNNTQIATTAFVAAAIAADTTGVTSFNTRTGAVTLSAADITGAGGALLASPTFTGTPSGPTASPGTATTQIATTAFVAAAIAASGVTSFNGRTGAVTLIGNDVSAAGGALTASPTFTGTPSGPTATAGTNTTQLATTAFVTAAVTGYAPLAGATFTGPVTISGSYLLMPTTSSIMFNVNAAGQYGVAGIAAILALNATANPNSLMVSAAPAGAAGATPTYTNILQINATSVTVAGALNCTAGITGVSHVLANGVAYWGLLSGNPALVFASNNYLSWGSSVLSFFMGGANVMQVSGAPGLPVIVNGQGIKYALYAANNVAFQWTSTQLLAYVDNNNLGAIQFSASDATLKENLSPISVDCLSVVDQITLQQYDWIPTSLQPSRPHVSCGVTAQNVQTLIPEAVPAVPSGGTLSVDLMTMLAYCIGAIQQLSAMARRLNPGGAIP